jgi:hypothetical protein
MKAYHEVTIRPCHSGFGEYETNLCDTGECWGDEMDLVSSMRDGVDDLIELGEDDLPDGVEDIRPVTHHCPSRVFASRGGGMWFYCGIVQLDMDDGEDQDN